MTLFWLLAAGLIALALALVLPALLRQQAAHPETAAPGEGNRAILREQLAQLDAEWAAGALSAQQHEQARAELLQRVLEEDQSVSGRAAQPSTRSAVLVSLAIPGLALALYGLLGNPQALQQQESAAGQDGGAATVADVEAMVDRMARRLEDTPAGQPVDPRAWEMLARSYAALQRFPQASRAYARAVQAAPDNAQLLADHADVLAMMQGQRIEGEPLRMVERALVLDPGNLKALALAGSAAYSRKDFKSALVYWSKAEQLAPAGSDVAQSLARSAADARQAIAPIVPAVVAVDNSTTVQATAVPPPAVALPGGPVQGVVELAPALAARVLPGDTVFIFARAAQGPRMPLAILRYKASDLPIRFVLDDSTAMTAELRLSRFAQVVVGARISRSGNAMPQSGDLVGQAGPLASAGAPVRLTIDTVQP